MHYLYTKNGESKEFEVGKNAGKALGFHFIL